MWEKRRLYPGGNWFHSLQRDTKTHCQTWINHTFTTDSNLKLSVNLKQWIFTLISIPTTRETNSTSISFSVLLNTVFIQKLCVEIFFFNISVSLLLPISSVYSATSPRSNQFDCTPINMLILSLFHEAGLCAYFTAMFLHGNTRWDKIQSEIGMNYYLLKKE